MLCQDYPRARPGQFLQTYEPEALQEGFSCREARRRSARQIAPRASGVFTTNPRLSVSKMRPIYASLTGCLRRWASTSRFTPAKVFQTETCCLWLRLLHRAARQQCRLPLDLSLVLRRREFEASTSRSDYSVLLLCYSARFFGNVAQAITPPAKSTAKPLVMRFAR